MGDSLTEAVVARNFLAGIETKQAGFFSAIMKAVSRKQYRVVINNFCLGGRFLAVALVALVCSGCATSSIFVPYPVQMAPIKRQLSGGNASQVLQDLDRRRHDADRVLYLMERARAAQISGNYQASIDDFKEVINAFKTQDEKARFTVSGGVATGAAFMTNDNALPYTGEDYERVFVYQLQALNYLFVKDVDAALVEVRRANVEQQVALEKHSKEVADAEQKNREVLAQNRSFMNSFSSLQDAAGHVKNSFQNAYTFYVSGLIYEATGSDNDAYIDYKKALEIFPENIFLQRDVLRLARKLSMDDDIEQYSKQYPIDVPKRPPQAGEVVVIFEDGFAPVKREIKVPIIGYNRIYAVAFPTYDEAWRVPSSLVVYDPDGHERVGSTEPIVSVQALAAKALQEDLPGNLVRQVFRLVAKRQMADQTRRAFGDLGELAVVIANVASENADQRSWLTLPNNAQVLRGYLAAGQHTLQLQSGLGTSSVAINVEAGKTTLIRVIDVGGTLHSDSVVL